VLCACCVQPLAPPLLQVQSLEDSPVSACLPLRASAYPVLVPVLRHGGHAVVHGGQFQTGNRKQVARVSRISVCLCCCALAVGMCGQPCVASRRVVLVLVFVAHAVLHRAYLLSAEAPSEVLRSRMRFGGASARRLIKR